MHWLVCFDIGDNKVRRQVVNVLLSAGVRVQYSMFEITATPPEFKALSGYIASLIEEPDRLHYIPLNPTDLAHRRAFGIAPVVKFSHYWLVG